MDHGQIQLLLIFIFLASTSGIDYYVQPAGEWPCQYDPCHTLDYYTRNITRYFASGSKFLFLPGTHYVNVSVHISNIRNLTLSIQGRGSDSDHNIQCQELARFHFTAIIGLRIENLNFFNCGQRLPQNGKRISCKWAALVMDTITNLNISGITVYRSKGHGMRANNLLGRALIFNSTFELNEGNNTKPRYYGGNAVIAYNNCSNINTTHELLIESSHFLNGSDPNSHALASGLMLIINCTNVRVHINNTVLKGNQADKYGYGGNLGINVINSAKNTIYVSNSLIEGGSARYGGGMVVSVSESPLNKTSVCNHTKLLSLFSITFIRNYASAAGGALYFERPELFGKESVHIVIKDCNFSNNSL